MVLGREATRLLSLATTQSIPIGTAFALGLILFSMTSLPSVYGPKQDYLGALAFVESKKEPGDTIVTVGLATFPYKYFYKVDWQTVDTLEALDAIRARSKRTWLLYTLPPVMHSVYPEIMASIGRDFGVVKQFHGTLREGVIVVGRSDIPRPSRQELARLLLKARPSRRNPQCAAQGQSDEGIYRTTDFSDSPRVQRGGSRRLAGGSGPIRVGLQWYRT